MLTPEIAERVKRQVTNITAGYEKARAEGYDVQSLGLPTFTTQQDHDLYHPDDAGQDFNSHNEFALAIRDGLKANGVTSIPVNINYSHYLEFLSGKKSTSETRAAYCAMLVAKQSGY